MCTEGIRKENKPETFDFVEHAMSVIQCKTVILLSKLVPVAGILRLERKFMIYPLLTVYHHQAPIPIKNAKNYTKEVVFRKKMKFKYNREHVCVCMLLWKRR